MLSLVERATNDLKQVASKADAALEFIGGVHARTRIDTAAIGRAVGAVSRPTLRDLMKKHAIDPGEFRAPKER
jgi:hypothetical protein